MLEMIKKVREEKEGFTLAELLIVVAIILVLVAIAIPVFTGALDSANSAVKDAQIRSVKAVAVTDILLNDVEQGTVGWVATADVTSNGDITNLNVVADDTGGTSDAVKDDANNTWDVDVYIVPTDVTHS